MIVIYSILLFLILEEISLLLFLRTIIIVEKHNFIILLRMIEFEDNVKRCRELQKKQTQNQISCHIMFINFYDYY